MQVQVVDGRGNPFAPFGDGETVAEFKEYTNKVTHKPDPTLTYKGGFIHMSTAMRLYSAGLVKNLETGEIISVPDLSPP